MPIWELCIQWTSALYVEIICDWVTAMVAKGYRVVGQRIFKYNLQYVHYGVAFSSYCWWAGKLRTVHNTPPTHLTYNRELRLLSPGLLLWTLSVVRTLKRIPHPPPTQVNELFGESYY